MEHDHAGSSTHSHAEVEQPAKYRSLKKCMKEHTRHSSQLNRSLVQFSNYFMTGSWCEILHKSVTWFMKFENFSV